MNYPRHAEHDAIEKLIKRNRKRRKYLINVDIIVIRFNKNNKLTSSKPCVHCIHRMLTMPEKYGYKINNIYYSDENGNIIKTKINELIKDDKLHMSKYFRNRGYNNPLEDITNCENIDFPRNEYKKY